MKTNSFIIAPAAVAALLSLSFAAMAGDNKTTLTFLDTLNKGKELSISAADFVQPPSSAAAKAETPSTDSASAPSGIAPDREAGVVASRFRIQVLASTLQEQVKKVKNDLASRIDIPITISFESPYYKLFAGEFEQRSEAENYLAQVKKLGYNDAWISRTAAFQK